MKFLLAFFAVFVGLMLVPESGERKVTYYPGYCASGQNWYLYDSDDNSVTVACYDPDYVEPDKPDARIQ